MRKRGRKIANWYIRYLLGLKLGRSEASGEGPGAKIQCAIISLVQLLESRNLGDAPL